MKTGKSKRISVIAESKNLLKVRDFVEKNGKKVGLLPKQVREVKLAVDEAVSNVVRHAYPGKSGNVQIEMTKLESAAEIKIMDKGIEFDWNSVLEPDLYRYVETRRKGGLGIWLIKRLMDEVVFERVGDTNILTMRVYLQQLGAAATLRAGKGKLSIRTRFVLYAVALITVLIFVVYNIGTRFQIKTIRNKFIDRYTALTDQVAQTSIDLILEEDQLKSIVLHGSGIVTTVTKPAPGSMVMRPDSTRVPAQPEHMVLKGRDITITLVDESLEHLRASRAAMYYWRDDVPERQSAMGGNALEVTFDDGEPSIVESRGNAVTRYFDSLDTEESGLQRAMAALIRLTLHDGDLEKAYLENGNAWYYDAYSISRGLVPMAVHPDSIKIRARVEPPE